MLLVQAAREARLKLESELAVREGHADSMREKVAVAFYLKACL